MKAGDSVVIVARATRHKGADHTGRTGIIRTMRKGKSWGPTIDVRLDIPLPDRRQYIWFYERELQVL